MDKFALLRAWMAGYEKAAEQVGADPNATFGASTLRAAVLDLKEISEEAHEEALELKRKSEWWPRPGEKLAGWLDRLGLQVVNDGSHAPRVAPNREEGR